MNLETVLLDATFIGLTNAECVTKLEEITEVSRDTTAYTWTNLNAKLLEIGLPDALVTSWNITLADLPGGSMLANMLSAAGVDLSHPVMQAQLTAVRDAIADPTVILLLNAFLQIGIKTGPLWEARRLSALPSEQEIIDARTENSRQQAVATMLNECINPLVAGNATVAEIQSAVAAWGP